MPAYASLGSLDLKACCMKLTVIEQWQATYPDPISLKAGDMIILTGRQDNWEGHIWVWAKSMDGLEGWIPDTIVKRSNAGFVATEDYTAAELTCQKGETVTGEKETHGWVFCRASDGRLGWVPRKNLAPSIP